MLIFGMKAYLINVHLLVQRSRSNIKVTFSKKNGHFGGIRVSQTHLVFYSFPDCSFMGSEKFETETTFI